MKINGSECKNSWNSLRKRILGLVGITVILLEASITLAYADPVSLDPNYDHLPILIASGLSGPANGLVFRPATNDLLVSEYSANRVSRIDLTTGTRSIFGYVPYPDEMAINSTGYVFVKTSLTGGPISIFDSSGVTPSIFTPFSGFPTGVAFDSADNFYVAETSTGTIWKFAAGTFTSPTAFAYGFPSYGFPSLEGIAFSPTGQLFATDFVNGNVYQVTPGLFSHIIWASGLSKPLNFGFDPCSGDMFVSNSTTIVRVPAPGIVTTFASGFGAVYDLDFDPAGNLYADDFSTGNVWEFPRITSCTRFAATKDFRFADVNFTVTPAQLGTLLPQNGSKYNVTYVTKPNTGTVSSTNPGQLYGVVTINGTGVANVTVNDSFGTQFVVNPAHLGGGVEVLRVNTTTGNAILITDTPQVTPATVNVAGPVNLTINLTTPLASDEKLMIYIKFETALKGLPPDFSDFVNKADILVNGSPGTATAAINFV